MGAIICKKGQHQVKQFYKGVENLTKQVPPVQETVKHVPDIYKRGK